MFPKNRRVARSEFAPILKKGRTLHSPLLSLRVLEKKQCEKEPSTFAFVVSKKVAAKATARNRIKRRGYATLREIQSISPCHSCVVFFKKGADTASFAALKKEILSLFKEAQLV
ncbi:MAG: ribonuclease P protein component [Parcubacteria group bacterium]|nr:ribonuclease P protein component [Parcubacteria group bacterium]